MILFHFPPLGGVAMSRNTRNVEHLPEFGWDPVVIAPRTGDLVDRDSLELVARSARVIRTRWFRPEWFRPLVNALRRPGRPRHQPATVLQPDLPTEVGGNATPFGFWRLRQLLFFPDAEVGWLPFGVLAAVRAHRATRIDAVYSTASPVTAHLIAGLVHRLLRVPWVAEFRDPWVGNPMADPLPWFHRRLQLRIERWIVQSADRIVFVSPSTARLYRTRYPLAKEMVTISNGHDPSERVVAANRAEGRPYRIVWTGELYRPAELRLFLDGLRLLVARRPAIADELQVQFFGHMSNECAAIASEFSQDSTVGRIVRFRGFVPRRVALQAVADADASLVMLGAGRGMEQFVPGKLFDALGMNKQVLGVLPPGDARDILEQLGWGVIADPDVDDVGRAIELVMTLPRPTGLADPEGLYDRVRLAGCLAQTLDDVAVVKAAS